LEIKLKIFGIAAKWLFIFCLPTLLLTGSIGWVANSLWFYEYGFHKYNISQTTGLAQPELEKAATGLISYFNSDEEYITLTVVKDSKPFELFNSKEVSHLKDVKRLIWLDYRLLLGTLIYTLGYAAVSLLWRRKKYYRHLAWGMAGGSGITLALILALGLGTLLNFDWLFLQFHFIAFVNELWLLDPSKDYLIMLFPQGFWYDAALLCFFAVAVGAVILGGMGIFFVRKRK